VFTKIILDYQNGTDLKNLAKKWNIHEHTIYKFLQRLNIKPNRKRILTESEIKEIVETYLNSNLTIKEVALKFNLHPETVGRLLHKRNAKIKHVTSSGKLTKKQVKEIMDKYMKGKTTTQLAKEYNVGDSTIYRYSKNFPKKFYFKEKGIVYLKMKYNKLVGKLDKKV
jgi:transposase